VVAMERELEIPALVILDEVGTGTDPAEGGALGTALVDSDGDGLADPWEQLYFGGLGADPLADPDGVLRTRYAAETATGPSSATALLVDRTGTITSPVTLVRAVDDIRAEVQRLGA